MDDLKISVIVPVYNTEKYISKCLNSLINQTLKDIEIICVDDGSKDESSNILRKFAEKDNRIKVLYQKHSGAGAARNYGLKVAKGEYVSFIDSDDWIDLKTFEFLYNEAKTRNTDIIMFKLINYSDEDDYFYETDYYNIKPLEDFFQKDVFSYENIKNRILKIAVSTVNKFYKRSFLTEINVKFPEGIMFEDNAFFFKCILNAKKIFLLDKHLYYRRRHNSSVMSSVNRKLFDVFTISNIICDIFVEESRFEFHKKQLVNFKLNLILGRYKILDSKYKDEFFELMVKDFSKFNEYFEEDENFSTNFTIKNSKLYSNLLKANNSTEFDLLKDITDLKTQKQRLKHDNKKLKSKNEKLVKELENIRSTISWRITKFLRIINRKIK